MSTNAYAGWGSEPFNKFVPGEDLTNYVGHAVYLVAGTAVHTAIEKINHQHYEKMAKS